MELLANVLSAAGSSDTFRVRLEGFTPTGGHVMTEIGARQVWLTVGTLKRLVKREFLECRPAEHLGRCSRIWTYRVALEGHEALEEMMERRNP